MNASIYYYCAVDTPQLTSKDHSTISRLLNDLNPEKLRCLGGALGLLYGNLQRMRNLLADMVSAWLNGEDDVTNMDGVGDTRSLEGLIQGLLKCNMKGTADEVRKVRILHTSLVATGLRFSSLLYIQHLKSLK